MPEDTAPPNPYSSQEQPAQVQTLARYDFIVNLEGDERDVSYKEDQALEVAHGAIMSNFAHEVHNIFQDSVDVRIIRLEKRKHHRHSHVGTSYRSLRLWIYCSVPGFQCRSEIASRAPSFRP